MLWFIPNLLTCTYNVVMMEALPSFASAAVLSQPLKTDKRRRQRALVYSSILRKTFPSLRCSLEKQLAAASWIPLPGTEQRLPFVCNFYSKGESYVGVAHQERPCTDPDQTALFLCEKSKLLLEEGLTASQSKALVSSSEILVSSSSEQFCAIIRFLKSLDIQGQRAAIVLSRYPKIVDQSAAELDAKLLFLQESGLSKRSLEKFVLVSPRTICMSLRALQKHVTQILALGIDGEGLNKIIWRSPRTLCWDIDALVKSLEEIGASKSSICLYLTRYPLTSVNALARKLLVLEEIGFNRSSEKAFRALWRLSLVPDNRIVERFEFLKNQGLSHDETVRIVTLLPDVLAQTEENVSQKIDYLVNVLNYDIKDIVKFPAYLTYSLQKRIIPRFDAVIEAKNEGRLKGLPSLANVLTRSKKTFPQLFVTQKQEALEGDTSIE